MASESGYNLLDRHFSQFLADRSGLCDEEKEQFRELVARLSRAMGQGHSCLPLAKKEAVFLAGVRHLVSQADNSPLVVDKGNLYLQRYFLYESRLADQLKAMAVASYPAGEQSETLLKHYFTEDKLKTDWQKKAAAVALAKRLTIISGGPGTGKTSTVLKIIAILVQALGTDIRIALAAPTGKAAMRLQLSIASSLESLDLAPKIKEAVPKEAKTLHRLLGVRRNSPQFRHKGDNPMSWDVVVVDEASMVDLALMSKLVDALKTGARLILLGDKDQLASVESGAVLADCIKSLPENTVELQKTYRFDSGIKKLATSINEGDPHAVWSILSARAVDNVGLLATDFSSFIGKRYQSYMEMASRASGAGLAEVFASFNEFQVLCSVHYGDRGVEGINRKVEFYLAARGFDCTPDGWYAGRPVLVTSNDYSLGLYNGDIGICARDPGDFRLKVWFEKKGGGYQSYLPYRLPKCATAFAMTIHKSQGSEFDEVLVVLPAEDNRVLCRELLYTAVTRARKRVRLVAFREVLEKGILRQISRHSGLADRLHGRLQARFLPDIEPDVDATSPENKGM